MENKFPWVKMMTDNEHRAHTATWLWGLTPGPPPSELGDTQKRFRALGWIRVPFLVPALTPSLCQGCCTNADNCGDSCLSF